MSTIEKLIDQMETSGKQPESEPKRTVVTEHEVQEELLVTEVIEIDESLLEAKGMVCVGRSARRAKVNDEFRAIKHKLVNNAFGAASSAHVNGNLIMVSSSSPNEGKTFNAVNLALVLSLEKDKSVLLVDADVRNPSVGGTLGIEERQGLIDYLNGDIPRVSDIIYNTSIPNLRLMPAGIAHDHLTYELLASDKMYVLAQELASRYSDRIVIFDCPPLLGVIETISLSKLVGQVVIVVEQNKTKVADIKDAVSHLDKKLAIGIVVNKSVNKQQSQYGYGYGYGYGQEIKE